MYAWLSTAAITAALTWHLRDHLKRSQTPKGSQNTQVERQRLLHNYGHAPDNPVWNARDSFPAVRLVPRE